MPMRGQDTSKDEVPTIWLATEGGSRRRDGRYVIKMNESTPAQNAKPVGMSFWKWLQLTISFAGGSWLKEVHSSLPHFNAGF